MDSLRLSSLIIYCKFYFGDGNAIQISSVLQNWTSSVDETEFTGISSNKPGCPSGWMASVGSCYLFRETHDYFYDALYACERYGGHLAVIESKKENIFLQSQLKRMKDGRYWIGVNDINPRGKVGWLFGFDVDNPLSTFTDFQPYTFVKNDTNSCGVFSPGHNYQWDFEDCIVKSKSICEKKSTPCP